MFVWARALRADSPLLALPVLAALSLATGCNEAETDTGPTTTTTTGPDLSCENAGSQSDGEPPAPAEDADAPAAGELVFAVSKFYLGALDFDGKPSSSAWKELGFNLDRTVSVEQGGCVCQPAAGGKASHLEDAPLGRDNSYGNNLVPMLSTLSSEFESDTNAAVGTGKHTWLFQLPGVGSDNSYSGLSGAAFEGATLTDAQGQPAAPVLDGSDVWPLAGESFAEGDPMTPRLVFEDAYVIPRDDGGILWVGYGKGSIRLRASYPGDDLRGTIHDPVVVLPISPDRTRIERGMLGGTLVTEELVIEIGRVFGFFEYNGESLCPPSSAFESIAQQVRQASDMLPGGAVDPGSTCDRISIGIAFDAVPAALGDIVAPQPLTDPCAAP